jgi:hypothetical protein
MNIITAFKEHFATLTEYKKSRGYFKHYYKFHFAGIFMYVHTSIITSNDTNEVLEQIIAAAATTITFKPIHIVISSNSNVDLLSAPLCVISIRNSDKLKDTVSCKIISNKCIGHKSFNYLDYDIVCVEKFTKSNINAIKVIDKVGLSAVFTNEYYCTYKNLLYIYLDHSGMYHVERYIKKYGLLCVAYFTTVIINEAHPLCEDLIEYMLANNYIDNDTECKKYCGGCITYTVFNASEFFINVDVYISQKLIKNANK